MPIACESTKNRDTLWQDAAKKEMKTVRPVLEIHDGSVYTLLRYYQELIGVLRWGVKNWTP
jgi:hypothetical protein